MAVIDDLPQLADPKLLQKIDKLFELNVGDSINLPQVGLSHLHILCLGHADRE